MFNIFKKKSPQFFTEKQQEEIVAAIQQAETSTSGEIRIYVESRCSYVDAIDRAQELFVKLKMFETQQRNAVLLYLAMEDKQLAIFADSGIFQKTGKEYWNNQVKTMIAGFNQNDYVNSIVRVILEIGQTLSAAFPYDAATDRNELPDEIVYGK
ncbi:MAG: TPM domain-containing protein [Arachidicoccus sp.]|nr:TPM domain-containing protein [Arachidicoccus sp.]